MKTYTRRRKYRKSLPEQLVIDLTGGAIKVLFLFGRDCIRAGIFLKKGEHPPTLFVEGTIDKVAMSFQKMPEHHEEKALQMFFAGKQIAERERIGSLVKVFFVSEAWMSERREHKKYIRPSLDPERNEVLIISCFDNIEAKESITVLKVVRDNNGQFRELTEFKQLPKISEVRSPLIS